MVHLSDLTTLHLGGPVGRLVTCGDVESLVATVRDADSRGEPLLILAGGSNVVAADDGFPGTVALIRAGGTERQDRGQKALLTVEAGEPWDTLVECCVQQGLAGIECLSGIPGSTGATPIQNVGAYGQDVRETIIAVQVYDRERDAVYEMPAAECEFRYRSSVFKRTPGRWVVLRVTFALERRDRSGPIRYAELARALGVAIGETAPLAEVRAAVLALRRGKGMVIDPGDPDTVSAGSFFLNPVLSTGDFERLLARVREELGEEARPPAFPEGDGRVKSSAAWLIERAGFRRGYGNPEGIAISSKHTLALTNRGCGTARELVALASEIIEGVHARFGVTLVPEPILVGVTIPGSRG
jgi:UDP-N-acetylmuramate dehydrogenase